MGVFYLHKKCKKLLQVILTSIIIINRKRTHRKKGANMENIATINNEITAQNFNSNLFADFVTWIDRGEKTTRTYINNLRQFMAWLNYADIKNPIRQDIVSYRQWLCTEHEAITLDNVTGWRYRTDKAGDTIKINCKPNTVAQYLRSVCQFFKWTAANGLYPDIAANIHAPKIKHDTHKKDALTAKDVLIIEQSIADNMGKRQQIAQEAQKDTAGRIQRTTEQGKRLFAMYLLAVNAGLRTVEISRANIKDLEIKSGQAWLYIWGKGHTEPDQKKPLAPEVLAAVQDYLQSRTDKPNGNSPLFVGTSNRSKGKRIATTTISTMLKKAMQDAGYNSERLTAHSLRHTAGTNVQELTGDIYTTQKYMRHSNPATTEIYLHNDTERQEAGIAQALYNLYHGIETDSHKEKLETIINKMSAKQLEQLATIAGGMI